jgi:hypothetical protein
MKGKCGVSKTERAKITILYEQQAETGADQGGDQIAERDSKSLGGGNPRASCLSCDRQTLGGIREIIGVSCRKTEQGNQ